MKLLLLLAGIVTVGLVGALLVWSLGQAKSGNWQPFLVLSGCAALLTIVLLIFSSPKIYRSIFGKRLATEVVKEGDRLDLGDGKFRLLVGKELNYRILFPGEVVCLKADKPYIQILADQWGQKIPQPHLAGARTLLGETDPIGVTLEGKVSNTTIEIRDGWCPPRR